MKERARDSNGGRKEIKRERHTEEEKGSQEETESKKKEE